MSEMLAFARRPSESINAVLARYEVVRQRAALEGQFVMSNEGCALQLLRACGVQAQHLFNVLQPFGGQLPQNDVQFQELCAQLRHYGHISENAPAMLLPPCVGRPGRRDQGRIWRAAMHEPCKMQSGARRCWGRRHILRSTAERRAGVVLGHPAAARPDRRPLCCLGKHRPARVSRWKSPD